MGDTQIRLAAFDRVRELCNVFGDDIPWAAIASGIIVGGDRVLLANKAVGIFKPRQLSRGVLSIKTTRPRKGRTNVYSDHEDSTGDFIYALQGDDPGNHYNRSLAEAHQDQAPIIYFHAVSEGVYKAIFPCFVTAIDYKSMSCRVTVGATERAEYAKKPEQMFVMPDLIERRYAVREAKVRLHQAEFREMVIDAYSRRCAMSALPVPELLEAAHIIPDGHEEGIAGIRNGICLSRIHHRAYDANLIGVTPDYKVHISDRLKAMTDGPLLEDSLKGLDGKLIVLPKDERHWPDQKCLEERFAAYNAWKWPE